MNTSTDSGKRVRVLNGSSGLDDEEAAPPCPPTDNALWNRAAGGDDSAFTELFHRHAEAVWNHAYRLTGSWAAAEDVTSAAFVTAWRKCAEMTLTGESARPWFYTVAANLARSHGRGERRRDRLLRRVPPADIAPDHADAVADRLHGEERLRQVVAAIARLPKAQRDAAQLCLLGDVSVAEAADVLDIAEVTVRSHLSRARARLRTILEES